MRTYDGIYLEVPNAKIWNRAITNYSRVEARRLDLVVGIGYDDDIDQALAALMDFLVQDPRVNDEPRAAGHGRGAGRHSVNLNLRCWAAPGDYWNLRFDPTKAVKQRLDAEGISIPFPQRDVHLFQEKD